ncbi:MAG: type II toxin-antitoxin system RatA family toxin [Granulosicoccaceae bacterium]|jgi:ribosome-associated toxin RatA of RatAB toxin-antitoxin module
MTIVNKSALVPYSAGEMFALVNDIESYPDFLPWCKTSTVLERSDDEVKASLELARGGIQKSFTTLNRMQRDKMIEMRLINGPFKHLEGFWRFQALNEENSKVMLDMEFEFASRLLSMTVGPVFSQITNTLVDAFTQRAVQVYGRR